ncbi:MAG: hypothetical protein JNK38_15255 [Acidobacteria bacterium]|nr:hypothetical protein [Acidobacteriota bacterium]
MQITVELSATTYENLCRQAQRKGLSVAQIAEQLIEESEEQRRAAFFDRLRAEGRILPKKPLPPEYQRVYKRIDVQGTPVSECLIEERR